MAPFQVCQNLVPIWLHSLRCTLHPCDGFYNWQFVQLFLLNQQILLGSAFTCLCSDLEFGLGTPRYITTSLRLSRGCFKIPCSVFSVVLTGKVDPNFLASHC